MKIKLIHIVRLGMQEIDVILLIISFRPHILKTGEENHDL